MSTVFFWKRPPLKNWFSVWIFLLNFKPTDQTTIGACLVLSRLLITFSAKPCLTLGLLEGEVLGKFKRLFLQLSNSSTIEQPLWGWEELGKVILFKCQIVLYSNVYHQACLPLLNKAQSMGILSIILLGGGRSNVDLMISILLLKQSGFKSVWCYHLQRYFSC